MNITGGATIIFKNFHKQNKIQYNIEMILEVFFRLKYYVPRLCDLQFKFQNKEYFAYK